MTFCVLEPVAALDLTMSDGATVRVRRHGNSAGPRLILSHGNGFAIDGYLPFWSLLLADFDLFVFDQRNHGRNPRARAESHTQTRMADDVETIRRAIAARFGRRQTAGIFHSLSATVSLLHCMQYGFQWDALILVDPPLAPPPGHPLHAAARKFEFSLSAWARGRRASFASVDELASYFKGTRRMRHWVPGAAELMARSITRPAVGGGMELVCPPEFEADMYVQNANSPAWAIIPSVAGELLIVCSDYDAANADPPGLVSKAAHSEFGVAVVSVPQTGHLLQIEQPGKVETIVREPLRARGFQ